MPEKQRISLDEIGTAFGETVQPLLHRFPGGRILESMVTGSRSPNYLQLDWFAPPRVGHLAMLHTVDFEGDKHLRPFTPRRFWERAAIVVTSLQSLREAVPEGEDLVPAVGFVTGRRSNVGLLPEGEEFGWVGDTSHVGAAFRLGRGSLKAQLGHWSEQGQRLHVPDELIGHRHIEPIATLAMNYPGVPLI